MRAGGAALAAAALAASLAEASAQGGPPDGPPDGQTGGLLGGRLVAGPGLAVNAQPYEDSEEGTRVFPIPLVSYRAGPVSFFGTTLTADLAEAGPVALSALASWRFQSYEEGDSPVLAGMDDRDGTLDLGVQATTTVAGAEASLSARADALSRHGGYEVEAQLAYELADGRAASLRPSLGLRYQSSSLADYYFGVDPEEAAVLPGEGGDAFVRPAYETGDALVPFVGVAGRYAVTRRVGVVGLATYGLLPDAITDSPIVGGDGQAFAFAGVTYAFGGR